MYSFLIRFLFVFIKVSMIQAYSHNYDSGRAGHNDQNNQMTKNQFNKISLEHDIQFQNSNPTYNDEDDVLYIGNGNNKNNVVIIDDGTSRHVFHNKNQKSGYDSNFVRVSTNGNGRNTVVINGQVYSDPGTTDTRRNSNDFRKTKRISSKGSHSVNSLYSPIIISCVFLICSML